MKSIKKVKKEIMYFMIETVVPFLLPIIFSIIPESIISKSNQNKLLIILALVDIICIIRIKRAAILKRQEMRSIEFDLKQYQITEKIMDRLLNCEKIKGDFVKDGIENNILPYRPNVYLERVFEEIRNLVAEISNIGLDCITVSFIYKCTEDLNEWDGWRWINWKEPSCNITLDELVKKIESLFHYLIANNIVKIFENNKERLIRNNHYWLGEKDKRYDKQGSIASYRMLFINNGKILCKGYISISTYGKKFYSKKEKYLYYNSKEEFEKILSEMIIPRFRKIIETELGFLYKEMKCK